MSSISIDEREPRYVFHLHAPLNAKGIGHQSYLVNTATGVNWTVTGDLAKALQRLERNAREEGAYEERKRGPE